MGIAIVLRQENGTTVEHAQATIEIPAMARIAEQVPMLRWLDPYGNLILNAPQRVQLMEELEYAVSEHDEDRAVFDELRRLCELARRTVHHYLWFIGD
jgi:hypothetical protein